MGPGPQPAKPAGGDPSAFRSARGTRLPGVDQVFVIARERINKKTGKGRGTPEVVYGITRHSPETADAAHLLAYNRSHWAIENGCQSVLDWNGDEDRCTLRKGHGPENITALRRFAIGLIRSKSKDSVASTLQCLARNVGRVFVYLHMSDNPSPAGARSMG